MDHPATAAPPTPATAEAHRASLLLAVVGVLLTLACALATQRMPFTPSFPDAGVSVDFVSLLGPGWERPTLLYLGFAALTFALYAVALRLVWRTPRVSRVALFGFPLLAALALVPMYPPTAMDMFHYQAMGRVYWVFGENPLQMPQGLFPYPIGLSWSELASPYGPLWSLLVAPAVLLPGEHLLAGLYALKAMALLSLAGCTALIWVLVRRRRPGAEAFAVALFAWNPFVLMRVVADGHNDLWMMLFVLLAFERIERGRWNASIVALTLGVLVKFVPAVLGPPFLLYIWTHAAGTPRQRALNVAEACALGAATAALIYLPFWEGFATFDNVRKEAQHAITSTPVLLQLATSQWFAEPLATQLAFTGTKLLYALAYAPLVWQARRSFDHLVGASFAILFVYLVLAATWFRPWYMLWPVALAALQPRGWLGATAVTITLAAACPDVVEQFRSHWPLIAEYHRAVAAPIVLAFLPPLVVWLRGVGETNSFTLQRDPPVGGAIEA
ncbi:MAG: glycosyltransferase 87 family protein [Dehalococcoidia bacterium]